MKNLKITIIFGALFFATFAQNINAQQLNNDILRYSKSLEDVLRFSKPNAVISPRVAALGFSYYGISDDASAMLFNPAGLSLVRGYEMGIGFNFNNLDAETDFLGASKNQSSTEPYFSNIQFAIPMEAYFGGEESLKYTIAFGYSLENDFNSDYRWSGFNTQNSFIAEQASMRAEWLSSTLMTDTSFATNINNNVQQDGRVSAEGGLHNLTFGIGVDASPNIAFGASIIAKIGSYTSSKNFMESDPNNLYNEHLVNDFDFVSTTYKLMQDVAAVTGSVGLQFKLEDFFRAGLSVKFPTYTYITEENSVEIVSQFDPTPGTGLVDVNNWRYFSSDYYHYNPENLPIVRNYFTRTPFEFSFGASANLTGLTFSLAASYQNMSSASVEYDFDDRHQTMFNVSDSLNDNIAQTLAGRWTLGIGAEYKLPNFPAYVRASYTGISSDYVDSDLGSFRHILGAGFSLVLLRSFAIEAGLSYYNYSERQANYGNSNIPQHYSYYDINFSSINYAFGFRYRF